MNDTVIEFGGLLFAMAVQLAVGAFIVGGLFQRVRSLAAAVSALETVGDGEGRNEITLTTSLARLETKFESEMKHLNDRFGEMRSDLTWLRSTALYELDNPRPGPRVQPRQRPRADGEGE